MMLKIYVFASFGDTFRQIFFASRRFFFVFPSHGNVFRRFFFVFPSHGNMFRRFFFVFPSHGNMFRRFFFVFPSLFFAGKIIAVSVANNTLTVIDLFGANIMILFQNHLL